MTKRPRSSVTTILANLVGSSVVSAITQTPASGPLGPVTVPPISSPSMATPAPVWPLLGPTANPIKAMRLTARLFVPMAATFSMSWSRNGRDYITAFPYRNAFATAKFSVRRVLGLARDQILEDEHASVGDHPAHLGRVGDILERIALHQHDVGQFA